MQQTMGRDVWYENRAFHQLSFKVYEGNGGGGGTVVMLIFPASSIDNSLKILIFNQLISFT